MENNSYSSNKRYLGYDSCGRINYHKMDIAWECRYLKEHLLPYTIRMVSFSLGGGGAWFLMRFLWCIRILEITEIKRDTVAQSLKMFQYSFERFLEANKTLSSKFTKLSRFSSKFLRIYVGVVCSFVLAVLRFRMYPDS